MRIEEFSFYVLKFNMDLILYLEVDFVIWDSYYFEIIILFFDYLLVKVFIEKNISLK